MPVPVRRVSEDVLDKEMMKEGKEEKVKVKEEKVKKEKENAESIINLDTDLSKFFRNSEWIPFELEPPPMLLDIGGPGGDPLEDDDRSTKIIPNDLRIPIWHADKDKTISFL